MNPLKIEGTPCPHARWIIDADDRHVHCSQCGLVLDAFDVLVSEARLYEQQECFLSKARGELAHLHEQCAEQRKALGVLRKSVDNENRKLKKLIARRKALEDEVEAAEADRSPPREGAFQLDLAALAAAERFTS